MVHRSRLAPLLSIVSAAIIASSSAFVTPTRSIKQKGSFTMKAYSTDVESVYRQMEKDGKKPLVVGPVAFCASLFLGVPFWFTVLLPFTIVSTAANLFWVILHGPKSSTKEEGVVEDEEKVEATPLSERKYDLVLLGVTGFTGKLAAEHLARQYGVGKDATVKWAVAGRSKSKIDSTLQSLAKKLGNDAVLQADVIIVDTSQRDTVKKMVDSTRTVITTAGPFIKYGSSVVELCAKYGTHYADITGEVDWNKDMMKEYESTARQSGAKIVSFCGHDSIPWDLTVRILAEKLADAGDELESVECLDEAQGGVSGGTIATFFETIEMGFDEFRLSSLIPKKGELDLYMRLPDGTESKSAVVSDLPPAISPCRNPSPRYANRWTAPFVMAYINLEIVRRGVALSKLSWKTPIKYREVLAADNFMDAFSMWFGLIIGGTSIINPVTRPFMKMLLPQPGQGPTEKQMQDGFLCVSGYGVGAKGTTAESVMYFPQDGGYTSTSRMLVESGLCLALDGNNHEFADGGFYSPSSLMCHALMDRLIKTGTHFACSVDVETKR